MSDKGREAIEQIVGAYMARDNADFDTECKLVTSIIRSNRFIHEDDVVEGRHVCESACNKDCQSYSNGLCNNAPGNCYDRPALVKDLIG